MTGRPRPVLTAAGISGLVTSVAGVLAFLGYTDASTGLSSMAQTAGSLAVVLIVGAAHVYAGLKVQKAVTPVKDPLDVDGVPLVRKPYDPAHAAPEPIPAPDPESVAGERLDMIPDPVVPPPA